MADVQSNIHVNIDTSDALASLKLLQRQISAFHTQMSKSGAAASAVAANQAQNLMNSINATGKFQASMRTVTTSTEHFTNALEKNKLTSREYFRYTGAATKTFGRLFKSEFETINKVARERVKDIQTQYIKMGRGANGALQAIAVRPLTLDMKNLATQTAMAAQRQQILNQLLKQGSTNLLNFGKNTQWAGRQLMVGFTVPLMLLGSTAAKTFMKLEEQAIRFKRVYGEMFTTQEETDEMVKNIQLLAKEYTKYGVAVEKTMEMAANAAAMGKMGAELTAQVSEATRLAVLGGVEQEQALETTISVTNAFGVAAEDLAKKIDFLNAVENQTVVSIEDLTIAIPKAGPVVQQLGGDVEDLAFFLTAMKEGGINASEGANALKSGLASLINPSEKASKMLAGLGINITGIVEANKGDVAGTVVSFAQALDTLDPLNRARAIEQLFGKFQFSRLSTLFQNVVKEGNQASRVLTLTKATTEELAILSERELARIEESTTYKFKKAMEDLKVTLAPVGEQFLKALTPIVEFVSKILEKFNNLGDGSKKFLTIMTVALGAVGPIALMTFGLLANGLANIIKLFATMKSTFNRAGSSTQILGNQTDYLTKQQLEASAVAASLDQVHQKLRQTFTSETAAVEALASAYRRAIAAQVGFTGPVGGGRIPQSRRYSNGITSVPGPKGAGDIVPIMASPGEAVIPAGPAQDPANKPFIAHMVAGKSLPGFNGGTTEIKKDNNVINKTHVGGKSTPKDIQEIIKNNPYMSDDQRNKLLAMEQIFKSQGLPTTTTTKHGLIFDFPEWMNKAMPSLTTGVSKQEFMDEWERRGPDKWKPSGFTISQAAALDRAFSQAFQLSTKPYINDAIVDDIFRNTVPKFIDPKDPAYQRAQELYSTDSRFNMGKGLGSTPEESRRILQNAKDKGFIKDFEIKEGFATGEGRKDKIVTKSSTVTLNDGTVVNMNRLGAGTTPVISQKPRSGNVPVTAPELIQENMEKARSQEATLKAIADKAAATKTGQKKATNFGKQLSTTSGRSFDVREIGGVYEKPNGQKVFVKPMMSELDAIAEKRATDFARDVQGLDTPKQTIRTMIDPTDPAGKRKIIVLESKYNPKYADAIAKTFTQDEYFKQLVSANLRGDNDLKRGNLGGNVLTDVGRAGVFDKASGQRVLATTMPSLVEMAEQNLKGVPGKQAKNSPNWFANATKDIALNMTPDAYDKAMKEEIKKQLAKAEPYVAKMPATDPLKPQYIAMIERLKEGLNVDWKALHQKHSSIVVKPDELIEDEKTGKLEKPKTEAKPANIKSSSGSPEDKRIMQKPKKGKRVVQGPRGRFVVPGFANAPLSSQEVKDRIERANSQAKAAASRTALYGDGPIDAEQKALRRHLDKLKTSGKKLNVIAKEVAVTQKVVTDNMTENMKQNMKMSSESLRSKVVGRVANSRIGSVSSRILQSYNSRQAAKLDPNNPNPKGGMGMAGGAMAISGLAMMGSMVPGKVGEISQKIMMPLMGIAMVLPMLQNKFAALAVGVGAIIAAYAYQKIQFDKAQDSAMNLTEAMGSGSEAIKGLSKFAKTVSAGEIMDRKRKEAFSPFQIQTGKTTFGQSYIAGEDGKALTKNVTQTIKSGGKVMAQDQLANQLSTAVASGAITAPQARSIVANLAQELGDYSFGIQVNAKMIELLGPNGENLAKDPIGIRVKLLQDTREKMNLATDSARKAGAFTPSDLGNTGKYMGAGAAIGAAGGALVVGGIGGTIGGILGSVVPGAGTVAGATAGTIAGAKLGALVGTGIGTVAGGIFGQKDRQRRIGEASGASIAMQKMALQQQQEMMDSVELQYQKEMDIARAKGDQVKMDELQEKHIQNRIDLLAENEQLVKDVQKSYAESEGATRKALMTGVDKAITKQYKGTALEDVAPLAKTQIDDAKISDEMKYTLKMQMASGQMDPMQMLEVFETFGNDTGSIEKVVSIITKFGGKFGNDVMGIVGMFKDPKQSAEFVARIETQTPEEAASELELFQKISQSGKVVDLDVMMNYYNSNPGARKDLKEDLDKIDELKGKVSMEVATTVLGKEEMAALRADQEYFDSLPAEQQKTYLQNMKVMFSMQGDPGMQEQYQNWLKEQGNEGKSFSDFVIAKNFQVTEASKDSTKPITGGGGGGGSKVKASPLDDLLKKLRDVRKNQIKVTEGFDASFKSLNKLFGGKKTIEVFSGIENDMRKLGAGEDLIELVVGMDPKEYEKQKNKLFEFDKKGNIKKIKDGAKSIGDALQSVKLGEFVSEQQKMANQIGNQTAALKRLQAAGVEGSVALEAVADATFAAAIANKKLSDEQIQKIVKTWNRATKAAKLYAANEAAINKSKEFDNRVSLLNSITNNITSLAGKYGDTEMSIIEAILNNPELANLMITPKGINQDAFEKLLQDALDSARTELKIKKLTIEGMQDIFDTGYGNAMEAFDVEEQRLRFKFEDDNKKLKDEIKKAEELIALKQEQIRIQEVGLKEIEDQEEKVNEKYDERLKALDEVEKANAAISQQQKGQLTLAEALTSGDIAAAARAAQEMRAASAADAVTKQKDALEKSREYELSQIRSKNGKSRIEIEKEIKKLQDEIYEIEQKSLEPNRETLRLNELALEKAIEGITVLDKTRDAWERIKNQVDLARVSSAQFVKQMQDALNIVNALINAYRNQTVNTDPIIPANPIISSGTTCDDGYELVNGNCVKKGTKVVTCDDGYELVNGNCVKKGTKVVTCDDGYELVNGNCVKKGTVVSEEKTTPQGPCGPSRPYYNYYTGECVGSQAEIRPRGTTSNNNNNNNNGNSSSSSSTQLPGVNTGGLVAQMHLEDLNRMALNMEVAKITQNAGSVAGLHYKELVTMSDRAAAFTKELEDAAERKKIANMGGSTPYLHVESLSAKAQKASADAFTAELKAAEEKRKADEAAKKKAAADIAKFGGNAIAASQFANWGKAKGGLIKKFSMGGIIPRFLSGGFAKGTDTVPAMLTPGEFVMSKYAVDSYGVDNMKKINSGDPISGTVYNNTYTLTVNAKTDANPNEIAQAVMATIKQVDDRRVRGVAIGARK
jgi:TP901 family phage tail tape measure protein